MKNTATILLILLSTASQGQTWDEWFRQKKTQKKYLVDQIAALRVYSDYLQKGYQVVHSGLATIEQIKDRNFSLDQAFFDAQKITNPLIRNSAKAIGTVGYYIMSVRQFKQLLRFAKQGGHFSADEILYIGHILTNLIRSCDASLLELRIVTGENTSEMTDYERIERVDALYSDAQLTYSFVQAFANETRLLDQNRAKDLLDSNTSIQLHQQ